MFRCHPVFFLAMGLIACVNVSHAAGDPPVAKPKIITNSIGMKFALIPAGEFLMGSPESDKDAQPDEKPQHKVKITKPFGMGIHTVTVGQFRAFVKETGYKTEAEKVGGSWRTLTPSLQIVPGTEKNNWANVGIPLTEEHPVVIVDFPDAVAFCEWLSKKEGKTYRLPTEAEWEYACRAGTKTRWLCGDDKDTLTEHANIAYDHFPKYARQNTPKSGSRSFLFTAPVGTFKANAWGLHDMHGNVWQWCADRYGEDYYKNSPEADPTGLAEGEVRAIRGGTFSRGPLDCRSANRFGLSGATSLWVGFRVVAEHGKVKPERIEPKKVEAENYSLSVDFVTKTSEPVKVVKEWIGHFPKKHVKLLPREAKQDVGVIVDSKTFEAVWAAWSDPAEGTLPKVDFTKHFVLFRVRDAIYVFCPTLVDFVIQDGVLQFKVGSTQTLSPAFADKIPAVMVVLPRQGIRSFDTGNGVFELPGQPEPKAKETSADVERVYREYLNAAVSQDKKALERLLAEDYALTDDKGRHRNRTQLIEQLTGARIRLTSNTPSDLKVRVYGKAAVVTASCTEKGTVDHALFSVRALYTVVFVSRDGRWRIVAEHATFASN